MITIRWPIVMQHHTLCVLRNCGTFPSVPRSMRTVTELCMRSVVVAVSCMLTVTLLTVQPAKLSAFCMVTGVSWRNSAFGEPLRSCMRLTLLTWLWTRPRFWYRMTKRKKSCGNCRCCVTSGFCLNSPCCPLLGNWVSWGWMMLKLGVRRFSYRFTFKAQNVS